MQLLENLIEELRAASQKAEALETARCALAVFLLGKLGAGETKRLARNLKWRAYWAGYDW
jgi:hypothetical protein